MAQILLSISFDAEEGKLPEVIDAVHGAIEDIAGDAPMIGVEVDGDHRDPDDPSSGLFD